MQLCVTDPNTLKHKFTEGHSPNRLHHLTFSTCPYESTASSTASPDRSSSRVREGRNQQPKAQSIKSGCSRKSKYSHKNMLQKNCIFEKVEVNRDRDVYQKYSREKREELEGLRSNLDRLTTRKTFLQTQLAERQYKSKLNSQRVRGLLRCYFNANNSSK